MPEDICIWNKFLICDWDYTLLITLFCVGCPQMFGANHGLFFGVCYLKSALVEDLSRLWRSQSATKNQRPKRSCKWLLIQLSQNPSESPNAKHAWYLSQPKLTWSTEAEYSQLSTSPLEVLGWEAFPTKDTILVFYKIWEKLWIRKTASQK